MLATIVLLASLGVAADAPPRAVDPSSPTTPAPTTPAPNVAQPVDEPGFFGKYIPFGFPDAPEPEVRAAYIWFFVGMFVPFGVIWVPALVMGAFPDGYIVEAILTYAVHAGIALILFPTLICPPVFLVLELANGWYLTPVAMIGTFDRSVKAAKRNGTWRPVPGTIPDPSKPAPPSTTPAPKTVSFAMAY
jgi:hypothetical protein